MSQHHIVVKKRPRIQNIQDINLKIVTPCDELKKYVHAIWFASNEKNTSELLFKILNDGRMGITLNFGDEIIYQQGSRILRIDKGHIISVAGTDLLKATFTGSINTIGIRFYPAYNHHFLKCSMDTLSDKYLVNTADYFPSIDDLYAQIKSVFATKGSRDEVINTIERHLIGILEISRSKTPNVLINIINKIVEDHEITLKELSTRHSISIRQIQRLFKKHVGISPKSFIRLTRIENIKTKISENNFSSLTHLSADNGYFDQAHFIRDFKMLMEETPRSYHKLKMDEK